MPYTPSEAELQYEAIRAQGPGGQNVNKVSTAIQLRFDVAASAMPPATRARLLALADRRITSTGQVLIKAQRTRSQEQNKADALQRLIELIRAAEFVAPVRRATRPSLGAKRRRLQAKTERSEVKAGRAKVQG